LWEGGAKRRVGVTFAPTPARFTRRPSPRYAGEGWVPSLASPVRGTWIDSNFSNSHASTISRRDSPESFRKHCAPIDRGRRESRAHDAPAASRGENKNHTSIVTTGSPEQSGLPCAMVLTASFVLSPVTGLSCHRHKPQCVSIAAGLISASGYQDHTTSPSALRCLRLAHRKASTASRPTFVTMANAPLSEAGRGKLVVVICPTS
jgi:hypothetical protein